MYKTFRATVPVGDGQVTVSLQDGVFVCFLIAMVVS